MKSCNIFFCFILLVCLNLNAQLGKEAWHWNFGQNCSLDFSSGTPVVGVSVISTDEGCASLSDPNTGQLLFYTDGVSVWNKNNIQMPNGDSLFGNRTTSQSAVIVPKPGAKNLFYVFTCDYEGNSHGVCYTLVDMNLDGGNGDVVISTKNTLLTPAPTAEKLTAVRHCNGVDFWVLDHPLNSNAFYAYQVTSSGVNALPIISHTGTFLNNFSSDAYGCLKASPDGKRLAAGGQYIRKLEIFDFNNGTGHVSNPITISYPFTIQGAYGVSFSPDNSKLYATDMNNKLLYQYDVSSNNAATVIASKIVIDSNFVSYMGALQLAPDGKIYIVRNTMPAISVINNPNALGLACNFQLNAITLPATEAGLLGLPNFIEGGLSVRKDIRDTLVCPAAFPIVLLADSGVSSFVWSTGIITQSTTINNFGNYWVSYVNSRGCNETNTFHITQNFPPNINVLRDTTVCSSSNSVPISINATNPNTVSYNWNDAYTQAVHTISNQGTYWVDYTLNNSCVTRDSFNFYIDSVPSINLGKDTALCKPYTLSANTGEQYNWSTGITTQQLNVTTSGIYSVTVTSPQGCKNSDTINVTIYTPPIINVLRDSTECGISFSPVNVNATYSNTVLYNWSDGFTGQSHSLTVPGTYWVDFTLNNTCVSRDSFTLYSYPYPIVSLGNDTTFCKAQKILDATNSSVTYNWSTGQISPIIEVTEPGTYWVVVNRNGCLATDTLVVHPLLNILNFLMPNIVTSNNDNINDEIDFGNYQFSSLQLEIFNRWGNKIFESSDPTCVWRPNCDDGSYYYVAQYKIDCGNDKQNKTLKGFITVIK